jgi:hypothetical protein
MTILYSNSKKHTIEDEHGNIIPLEKAQELCAAGQVEDCNLSFQRLANYDFNWEKLDEFYRENP